IGREAIEATGKSNAASLLRQLLRLELIALERGDGGKDDINYRTTSRFLELFSIERLDDLPHPEDLMFR
ncbi:MAG: SMC-Scp complex subunit ScpB, partial [Pirellulales bacterium]